MTAERLPYPGLRAYERDETELFFGREGCVREMVGRLAEGHFLAVLGSSGSGKSSLVRTGLLDALELGFHPAGPFWMIADCHPGGSPMRNLAEALLQARDGVAPDAADVDVLTAFLRRGPRSVVEWANDGNLPAGHNLLLLIDQFEELFRYGDYAGREQAEAFSSLLLESAGSAANIHVVVTMRSEFLGACALIPGLAEKINSSLYLTRRLSREECRQAIEGPAAVVGFGIEPQLVARLLNDLAGFAPWESDRETSQLQRLSRQADQLPLMQHALSRLWQLARRRNPSGGVTLTLKDYLDIGQLQGALDQHAGEVVAGLGEAARPLVERVFRALVTGTNLTDAVRKPMRFGGLVTVVGAERAAVARVVDAFRARDCNFLRPSDDRPLDDDTIVDISHESLIRQWRSLAGWLAEEARASALWIRLMNSRERHAAGQGELMSGLDLANALAWWESARPTRGWASSHGGRYDEVERFLTDSREAEEKYAREEEARAEKERRGLRRRTAVYGIVAALAIAAAVWGYFLNERLEASNSELETAKAEVEGKNEELEGANAALMAATAEAERAQAEAEAAAEQANQARAEAEEAKAGAEAAAMQANEARTEAESARAEAEAALEQANAANESSLEAADRFVVGLAERLLVTPGIPNEEVQRQLDEGKAYLDELATRAQDKRRVALIQAHFSVTAALALLDRAEAEGALALTAEAERVLVEASAGKPTREETLQLLASYRTAARALDELGRSEEAEAKALLAVRSADAFGETTDGEILLERAQAAYQVAYVLAGPGRYGEAIERARGCLDLLARPEMPDSADRHYLEMRCHTVVAYSTWFVNQPEENSRHTQLAVEAFDRIPAQARTIPMLGAGSTAISNLGHLLLKASDYAGARGHFVRATELLENNAAPLDFVQRPSLRALYVGRLGETGDTWRLDGQNAEAVKWYQKARDVGLMDDVWRASPSLANAIDTALGGMSASVSALDWQDDGELLALHELTSRLRLPVLAHLIETGRADWCQGCLLVEKQIRFSALVRFDRVRRENQHDQALALADEIIAGAKAQLAGQPSERVAINARRAWFATVMRLVDGAEAMPSATQSTMQVRLLEASRARMQDFLAAFPGAWSVEVALGRVQVALARLHSAAGGKEEALAAAEDAARLFSRDGIELLAHWYRSGSGPVARDTQVADAYDARLARRNWTIRSFSVSFDQLWTDEIETWRGNFSIEDPRTEGDNPVERTFWQLENLEGLKIPEGTKEIIRNTLAAALADGESFVDRASREWGGAAATADAMLTALKGAIEAEDIAKAVDLLDKQWKLDGGPASVREALGKLLDESTDRNYMPALMRAGWGAVERRLHDLAAALAGIVLPRTNDIEVLVEAYRLRAHARGVQDDYDAQDADLNGALALKPDDPELLNALGYAWAQRDYRLPVAIQLLERATALAPDNPYIRDSLGWAYVKAGSSEKGLELLESAAAEKPDEAEILAHLGDAYRRVGRLEDATRVLTRAAELSTDDKLSSFIRQQLGLLAPEEVIVAAAQMLAGSTEAGRAAISTDDVGVAIRGFDAVSYHTKATAEQGIVHFAAPWRNALWLFSTAENRDLFVADPEQYAPAYGGFCAYCVAIKHKVHANPLIWAVRNGTLYLHQSDDIREHWLRKPDDYIADSEDNWSAMEASIVSPDVRAPSSERIARALQAVN